MTEEKPVKKNEKQEVAPEELEKHTAVDEKIEVEKDVITEIPEEEKIEIKRGGIDVTSWNPKTNIGQAVKDGKITDIDQILDKGQKIMEHMITEVLLPDMQNDLLMIGQAKGKFGGGQRRVFRQTQKKTPEGNKPSFMCIAVVGNGNGYVGVGSGKSKDTVPSREKALRMAKLNVFKIARGCGSWECGCKTPHSIPYAVEGKAGSVRVKLMPAPKGKGLCIEPNTQKILKMAGVKDIWSKTSGKARTSTNLLAAMVDALKKLNTTKILPAHAEGVARVSGKVVTA